jgi:peptidyl-dipeptidase Dcp
VSCFVLRNLCFVCLISLFLDGFEAFKETGNCFNKEVADRVYRFIYSAGNSQDPAALFRQFRGRDPIIEPMLRKKGLIPSN